MCTSTSTRSPIAPSSSPRYRPRELDVHVFVFVFVFVFVLVLATAATPDGEAEVPCHLMEHAILVVLPQEGSAAHHEEAHPHRSPLVPCSKVSRQPKEEARRLLALDAPRPADDHHAATRCFSVVIILFCSLFSGRSPGQAPLRQSRRHHDPGVDDVYRWRWRRRLELEAVAPEGGGEGGGQDEAVDEGAVAGRREGAPPKIARLIQHAHVPPLGRGGAR